MEVSPMTKLRSWKKVSFVFLLCVVTAIAAQAQVLTTLHSFDGLDGQYPRAALIQAADGNLYGTSTEGGASLCGRCEPHFDGTVFKMVLSGSLTVVHSFCQPDGGCPNSPLFAGVVQHTNGNLYGTTAFGGTNGTGTVYQIDPKGTLTFFSSPCGQDSCGSPFAGLTEATNGELYGTAYYGGPDDVGGVYKITSDGAVTGLHSFDCNDGAYPESILVEATDGNLYGTTSSDPDCIMSSSSVFRIGSDDRFTTLYFFCRQPSCADGYDPSALIQANDGNLYGATLAGGTTNAGTIFKISTSGALTTLYTFCLQPNCVDGWFPSALVQATDGNFYGTTGSGGSNGEGEIFRMTPDGTLTVLYSFCSQPSCADGSSPGAGLVQDTDGKFYGVTYAGGNTSCYGGCGTAFSLDMGLSPFVTFVVPAGKVGQTGGILGQGFTGTTSVSLNGIPASFTVESDTFIEATVPEGATTGYVTVTTPSGALKSNVPFHVIP
jgi:uncharacterized repeat protein (TIGR03803 family)